MKVDSIPISNKPRDEAWSRFINRTDVKEFFKDKDDSFKFPLERGWYEVWCQCWQQAWQQGWDGAIRMAAQQKESGK